LTNPAANDLITEFIRRKIRERINDPAVAPRSAKLAMTSLPTVTKVLA
jgi:hypothetical protein